MAVQSLSRDQEVANSKGIKNRQNSMDKPFMVIKEEKKERPGAWTKGL